MRAHIVGLGRLGLPVALTLEQAGHQVSGWDVSEDRREQILTRRHVAEAEHEPHLAEYLLQSRLELTPDVPPDTEIVLIAVQTPHKPEFEGCVPLDRPAEDFDYTALRTAVSKVASDIRQRRIDPLVVVISTCLPGTFERELRPLIDGQPRLFTVVACEGCVPEMRWRTDPPVRVAYHPLFIAMGSVIDDYRNPEFVLVGTDDGRMPTELLSLYLPLYGSATNRIPLRCMSITSAELTKVAYNAWLGYKLMLANGIAETCDRVGADCDDVMGTLKVATKRLVSTAYMTPGMGDGGGCHPRDQIALSWLAESAGLSHDPYRVVVESREAHAKWLADLWCDEADRCGLPMVMLGDEYKPNSTLRTGSHARLVMHYARARGREPEVSSVPAASTAQWRALGGCYFLATPHDWVLSGEFSGVMVDPWGVYRERDGLTLIRPGRRA